MTGTLINTSAIILGGTLGSVLGSSFSERVRESVMTGMSLVVMVLGIKMSLQTSGILILIGSICLGSVVGEIFNFQHRIDSIGNWLEIKASRSPLLARGNFSQGFITATLVFCVGPMAILGSIQDGLSGDISLLAVKSVLDGFGAFAFGCALGMGVTFSAIMVLIVQGVLTMGASIYNTLLTEAMISEITASGGIIMIGIAIHMLNIKQIRLANYLPALVIAPLITWCSVTV